MYLKPLHPIWRESFNLFVSNSPSLSGDRKKCPSNKVNDSTVVYFDYCLIQKANWINSEKAIKDLNYGKQILTIGRISETIK